MDWMIFFTALGALAALFALIAVPYAVVGYYKAHPKRQLLYSVSSRPLITNADVPELKVTVGGEEIADPHFVEFRMTSTSRADIPSSSFDAGRSLEIELDARGIVATHAEEGIDVAIWEVDGWSRVIAYVEPQLIKRGASLSIDFVAHGDATVEVRPPLIDVSVKRVPDRHRVQDISMWLLESGVIPFSSTAARLVRIANRSQK